MSIGSRIKEARNRQKLTQEELAKQIGVTKGAIANYENGVSTPKIELLYKLFIALNCDANYLYQDEMKPISDEFIVSPDEKKHIKKYRALDERGKKNVDLVLDAEYDNSQSTIKQADEDYKEPENIIQFHIPEYWEPVSAGEGAWNDGDPPEDLLLRKRPPRGASFVVRVTGNSMEPTFHHGDRLFIRSQDYLDDGQIGIFVMDGCMYVKELRNGQLISHNPAYKTIPLNENARCQGCVLGVCDESYFEK